MAADPMGASPISLRSLPAGLGLVAVAGACWAFALVGAVAQPVQKEVFTLDVTKRWYTAETVIDAMMEKAKSCWLSGDPAFAGFAVAGKRSEIESGEKIYWLDFKPVPAVKARKAARKPAPGDAAEDGRILRLFAVTTFSGGYGIGVEQRGIDIKPSMNRILSDLERRGVIAC